MIWMARGFVDIQAMQARRLYHCYDWHKFVWECFPNRPEAERDFLFRLDDVPGGVLLHVCSAHEPQRPALCLDERWQCRPVPERFFAHSHYRFDVLCNPSRKVHAYTLDGQRKKNSRREALIRQEDQTAWFARKAQEHGFAMADDLRIDPCRTYSFYKQQGNTTHNGTHIGARFTGILAVHDKQGLMTAFERGIGSARGFGFGLLLLAPV